jgi:hypothetical protein
MKRIVRNLLALFVLVGVVTVTTPCACEAMVQSGLAKANHCGMGGGCCQNKTASLHKGMGQNAVTAPEAARMAPSTVLIAFSYPSVPPNNLTRIQAASPVLFSASPPSSVSILRI